MTPFPDKWCEVTFGSRSANAPQLSLLTSTFFSKSSDFVLTGKVSARLTRSDRSKDRTRTPNLVLRYIPLSARSFRGVEKKRRKNFSIFPSYTQRYIVITRLLTSIGKPFSKYKSSIDITNREQTHRLNVSLLRSV